MSSAHKLFVPTDSEDWHSDQDDLDDDADTAAEGSFAEMNIGVLRRPSSGAAEPKAFPAGTGHSLRQRINQTGQYEIADDSVEHDAPGLLARLFARFR
ncbi:MAG: hypothetical protein WA979_14750 [Pacificimonas sp.]